MGAYNTTRKTWLARELKVADTFLRRTLGLMGKAGLGPAEGLWIKPCNSIHMLGMRFPIDVVFLDRHEQVVKTVERLRPWRLVLPVKGAVSVVELPAGVIARSRTQMGDRISMADGGWRMADGGLDSGKDQYPRSWVLGLFLMTLITNE